MRIVAVRDGDILEAYRLGGRTFKCFPPSTNTADEAVEFERVEDAAAFLCKNKGWGIRMNPGSGIIYRNLQVHLD
jgi:hypothetical protein